VTLVRRRRLEALLVSISLLVGTVAIAASLAVPIILLLRLNDKQLNRWSEIGQALSPVGIFFSGIGFIAVAATLLTQRRELRNQRDELSIAREEQARASEVVMRQLHTDLIKMAIEDPELLTVWPDITPGITESKKDHYCNLILNLQKVAYETHTIELAELRGALRYLMTSRDIYTFWKKVRSARIRVTSGDEGEDFFTSEVDHAFNDSNLVPRRSARIMREALAVWHHRIKKIGLGSGSLWTANPGHAHRGEPSPHSSNRNSCRYADTGCSTILSRRNSLP
jgi:hypothetical protein